MMKNLFSRSKPLLYGEVDSVTTVSRISYLVLDR